jgi:hypothetical protein
MLNLKTSAIPHYEPRFIPRILALYSQATIAAALAGNALANVGPKPA